MLFNHAIRFMTSIILLTLSLSMLSATNNPKTKEDPKASFKKMSTKELQEAVEKLSTQKKLPFEMGLELIKRWQTKQPAIK